MRRMPSSLFVWSDGVPAQQSLEDEQQPLLPPLAQPIAQQTYSPPALQQTSPSTQSTWPQVGIGGGGGGGSGWGPGGAVPLGGPDEDGGFFFGQRLRHCWRTDRRASVNPA